MKKFLLLVMFLVVVAGSAYGQSATWQWDTTQAPVCTGIIKSGCVVFLLLDPAGMETCNVYGGRLISGAWSTSAIVKSGTIITGTTYSTWPSGIRVVAAEILDATRGRCPRVRVHILATFTGTLQPQPPRNLRKGT